MILRWLDKTAKVKESSGDVGSAGLAHLFNCTTGGMTPEVLAKITPAIVVFEVPHGFSGTVSKASSYEMKVSCLCGCVV